MDRNKQKQTETDRNRQKLKETDRNGMKRTETDRNGQKRTESERNRKKRSKRRVDIIQNKNSIKYFTAVYLDSPYKKFKKKSAALP